MDCVSIFALDSSDAQSVLNVADKFDSADCFSRELTKVSNLPFEWKLGVPKKEQLKFFGDIEYEIAFSQSVELLEKLGGQRVEVDFQPFIDAANLLYSGPWVNERFAAVGDFIAKNPASVLETTFKIITSGLEISAPDVFKSIYKLQEFKRQTDLILGGVEFLVTPTAGARYKRAEIAVEPILLNSNLGYYTNYMNLLDYFNCSTNRDDSNLPFGVTLALLRHDRTA